MPVYDYKCPCCERKDCDVFVHRHDVVHKCIQCGAKMARLFTDTVRFLAAKIFPSEGIYLEHVSPTGKTFHSEKEMRQWEKDTGQELGALL